MIQDLASDKVYCTHNNRQHIYLIFRECMYYSKTRVISKHSTTG